jgi:AraC family transcriptional regulator
MQPRIEKLKEKKLIGKSITMSFADNKTGELWRSFMPRRREIANTVTTELFSLQVYLSSHFENFDPNREFKKWALVEVADFDNVPRDMETFTLTGGLYAVFQYKGSSADTGVFQYIYTTWLPNSDYVLDERPHFEILGEKYKNDDPDSEEEIWIPVKPKN